MKRFLLLSLLLTGCEQKMTPTKPAPEKEPTAGAKSKEPERIEVQMALITFQPKAERTKAEAETLAKQLLEQLKNGADFPGIIRRFSYEKLRHPGGIGIVNTGVKRMGNDYPRQFWGNLIGDTVFTLEVGTYSMIPYGSENPYGWFLIRRVK